MTRDMVTIQLAKQKVDAAVAVAAASSATKVNKLASVRVVNDYIPSGVNPSTVDTAPYWAQAIADAGVGGVVRCNGAFKISSEIQLLNFQTVEGDANFYGSGGGITTNFLDFRTLAANGDGQRVGFRLAASNVFRRLLLVGPGSTVTGSYGVSSVTNPSPVATHPRFDQVQFYKWERGTNLYGAYYTVFDNCEWQYNAVGNYFDSCYNMKLVNPKITCLSASGSTYGVGIQVAGVMRSMTIYSGSIESYSTAILAGSSACMNVHGTYFETAAINAYGIDCTDGASNVHLTMMGCTAYLLGHTAFVRFTHMATSSLVGRGNKWLYNQYDTVGPDVATAPTVPFCYSIASPGTGTAVDLKGDNTAQCYRAATTQTWGYTDNVFTSGPVLNYDVDYPYTGTWEHRSSFSLRGRATVLPFRVVTTSTTLLETDSRILVNAAGATTQKLPAVFGQVPGRTIRIKNIGAGTVTVGTEEASGVTVETPSLATGESGEFLLYGGNWYRA